MKKSYGLGLLLFSTIVFGQIISTANPQAMRATTGTGLHKEKIFWINWDINNDGNPYDLLTNPNGVQTTFTSPAGYNYVISITDVKIFKGNNTVASNDANYILNSARTTDYNLNNFPTAYSGFPNNKDIISIGNKKASNGNGDGNRVTFRLTVTAVDPFGGIANAKGIVIAGSESLNGSSEYYTLSTPSGKVRLLDKYIRNNANWSNFSVQLQVSNAGKTIRATNPNTGDGRGDVILFAEDVPYVNCEVKGGGGQNIALGFLEELDYSDAPASYGRAFHLFDNKLEGGLFADGNTTLTTATNVADYASATGQLAKLTTPTLRLGAELDSEDIPTLPAAGAVPNVDDLSGVDDEDALPNATAGLNGYYGIKYVNISPLTSYLNMWVDRNRDGIFGTDEKVFVTIPPNKTGTAILDITSLNIPVGTNYYTRLRYSSKPNIAATDVAPDGEVEDHFVNVVNNTFSILGKVFQDNNSGIPDGIPLDQITVQLLNSANAVIQTEITNYNGAYIFYGLANGTYKVRVILPANPAYQYVSSTDATPTDGITTITVNSANISNTNFGLYFEKCYKTPAITTGGLPTNHGITSLGRAGNDGDGNTANDWPMVRTGAWTALESNTKGFVVNRVAANFEPPFSDGQVPAITAPARGMMIYDTTNFCLKIYNGTKWSCYSSQTCPVVN